MPQFSFARDTGTTGFNLQFYSPAIDPNGMWTVNSTKMLAPGQFYILTENNVSGGQFSVINLGVLVKIFDQAATTDVLVSMGVTDFVTLGVDMPITPWLKSADFNVDDEVENPQAEEFRTWGINDVRIYTKWRLVEGEVDKWWPGLGLLIYSTLPSGEENKFLGETQATVGATLIIDKTFPKLTVSLNAGIHMIPERVALGINIDDRLTFGGGISVPTTVFNQPFELIADMNGHMMLQNKSLATTALEFHTGFRKYFNNGIGISVAGGGAITNAIGNPDYRGIVSLFWKSPAKKNLDSQKSKSVIEEDLHTDATAPISTTTADSAPITTVPKSSDAVVVFSLDGVHLKSLDYKLIDDFAELAKASADKLILVEAADNLGVDYVPGEKWVPYERLVKIRNELIKLGIDLNRIVISVSRDNSSEDVTQGPVRMTLLDG